MKEINGIKIKSLQDLNKVDMSALRLELVAVSKKYFELKMKNELNELKQTHVLKILRRYIATIKTVINSWNI